MSGTLGEKIQISVAERPPRLVLRFAILSALCLGIGAAAILLFTRHLHTVQAEQAAARHAELLAETILADQLRSEDFLRPVGPTRRDELDRMFRRKALLHGTVLVTLSRRDRLVTYSTDHALIGRRAADAQRTREALAGTLTSDVTSIKEARRDGRLKVLRSHVPLQVDGRTGIVGIYQDYSPIESAAQDAFLPVAGILEAVLVLLYVLLLPILMRVSRRLRRHVEKIQYQALHDDLTELPNRLHFREGISAAIAAARNESSPVAILLLDLDRFKEINDTLGHQCGDELLKELAVRLRNVTDADALLARLGGDEFGIVAPGRNPDEALRLAQSVRSSLEAPFVARGVPLVIEASIGISVYPANGADVDTLIQHADVAMYSAKDKRLGAVIYEDSLDTSTAGELALMSELRKALEREEILIHFQPQIDVRSGRVVGMEALVRWQHPERGLLQPGAFIPLVERTGVSTALSEYVLTGVIRQLQAWRDSGIELDVTIAVNLTMFDLLDTSLPEKVERLLEETGVDPQLLELEITERVIMADPVRVREVVERLKEIGVRLAIDDFGTGYSSLSYLKSLPIDVIKIDRSFVIAMTAEDSDRAIVRSTIDLAHNLGLTVVAEGVETQETLDELLGFGCDVAQGFYIAPPAPGDDLWRGGPRLAEQPESAVGVG
jgi:diguanylate cyclase (GGDEF)-like protein